MRLAFRLARAPSFAPGKMYNCGTIENFALHSELVSGLFGCTLNNNSKLYNMKKKSKDPKNKWVQMRLTQAEYENFQALFKQSFYRERSVYLRRVLLRKKVLMKYKDESADEILAGLLRIQNE